MLEKLVEDPTTPGAHTEVTLSQNWSPKTMEDRRWYTLEYTEEVYTTDIPRVEVARVSSSSGMPMPNSIRIAEEPLSTRGRSR